MDTSLSERVRQIIAESGLKQHEIAARVGIDETKLSKSLSGKRKFSSLELALIAQIGDRTVDWLLTGVPPKNFQFAARTNGISLLGEERTATELLEDLSDRFDALKALGLNPQVPSLPKKPTRRRYVDEANEMAHAALTMFRGAQVRDTDVAVLASDVEDSFGINVVVDPLPDDLDGLSYQDADFRLMVLSPTRNAARQRFTLAHELGHLLFRDAEEQVLAEKVWSSSNSNDDHREERANAFAASFLMPKSEVEEALRNADPMDKFDELVWQFRVAPSTMSWRLRNLGFITEDVRRTLSDRTTLSVAKSRRELTEFAMRSDASERLRKPWLLVSAYLNAYNAGEVTLRPVASLLGWTMDQVEAHFGDSAQPDDRPIENHQN